MERTVDTAMPPTRVVIVGGGFGGFYTALGLERATRRGGPRWTSR